MPARSQEERERRKAEFEARKAARAKAKEEKRKNGGESKGEKGTARSAASDQSATNYLSKLPPSEANAESPLVRLSADSLHHILIYLPSRELGAVALTCRSVNYSLADGRVQHLLSRLNNRRISICADEAYAKQLLDQSLTAGGESGRLVTKKSKKKSGHGADEYVSYARFIESAVSGYEAQGFGGSETPLVPAIINGRLASVSPEHSLCRRGGGGETSGAGGTGVASWGVGMRGQLGHGKRKDENEPRMLVGGFGYGIRIVQVSAGGGLVRVAHSLLLTATGRVLSFGNNMYGQLGHGYSAGKQLPDTMRPKYIDALSSVRCICISAGELHSAAVTADGDLYTWGDGFCGQLGLGDKRPQLLPSQVTLGGLEDEVVESVSCGARHTLAVTEDGEVFSFGLGHFGVLGRAYTPFEYDADRALAGLGEEFPEDAASVADVPAIPNVALGAAIPFETATNNDRDIEGDESGVMSAEVRAHLDLIGNLSLDDSSDQCYPKVIDSLEDIRIVGASTGHRHSMVLDDRGSLYTFGSGAAGALGHGDLLKQEYPMLVKEFAENDIQVMQMSAGVDISMAVTTSGDVFSWGKSNGGRIGLTDLSKNVEIPRKVVLPETCSKAVDVECGYVHSLIAAVDGAVYQCGAVGTDGADDGITDKLSDGRPCLLRDFNIWHRVAEPKQLIAKTERWKKYGTYEVKGRRNNMSTD